MPFGYMPRRTGWKDLYLKLFGHPNFVKRLQAPVLMKMLRPREGEVLLDAGCGGGCFAYEIAKKCKASIGIDWAFSENFSFAMSRQQNLTFVNGDVQKLPFSSEAFDKVLLSSVLQMVEDDQALLGECHRVLKKEGLIVLSVPTEYIYLKGLNSHKAQLRERFGALGKGYYPGDEVTELLQAKGFEIIELEYSPKKWGSFIFEIGLFLWYRFGFPLFSPFLFPLLYPVAYLDHLAPRQQRGNEVIISARKVPR